LIHRKVFTEPSGFLELAGEHRRMALSHTDYVGLLSRSRIYRDYERAFARATELPLVLRPPTSWRLALQGQKNENPFCSLLGRSNRTCAECLAEQAKIGGAAATTARSAVCFAGLCDTAVPVRAGRRLVGFLQTGQVALHPLSEREFARIAQRIIEWGGKVDLRRLEDAYFHSRVLRPRQYAGVVELLEIFATHLGGLANELFIRECADESAFSRQARQYVTENSAAPIPLEKIANALHVSTCYFCKLFKRSTGLTFTEYLGRVRIERAKLLLLDPNLRICEIAYEVGFGSLTHFNRTFRRLIGCSPTAFRTKDVLPPFRQRSLAAIA
jgi:AraC-like DNA-binding protein/ligand-binding sensor protein